ncbi:hypothetical protein EDB84DRAFT_1672687 [Lactarius hengduanensis]|nr:hypothetical protein EDB84DRAFT_1672687 [Lactarius hengduanensis]
MSTYTFPFLFFFLSLIPIHLSTIILFVRERRVGDSDSMRKFLQFLTPPHLMAVAIMLYFAVGPPEIIVGTLAALALADGPGILSSAPRSEARHKNGSVVHYHMTKQILGQSYYQSAIILIFHIFGSQILGFHHTDDSSLKKHHTNIIRTLVFNVFVFAQIFNSFNCRRLGQKLNVFEGMWRNWYFMAVITIAFGVTHMGTREWVISLILASVSLPLGALIRLIPNERLMWHPSRGDAQVRFFEETGQLRGEENRKIISTMSWKQQLGGISSTSHVCATREMLGVGT